MKTYLFAPLVLLLVAAGTGCQHNLVEGRFAGGCTSCDTVADNQGSALQPQPEVQQAGHFRRVGGVSDAPKLHARSHSVGGHAGCAGCAAHGGHGAAAAYGPYGPGMMGHGMMGHGPRPGQPIRVAPLPHGYEGYMSNPANGGPPGPTYGYPYYTTRGPRDFLLDNPPSIGY